MLLETILALSLAKSPSLQPSLPPAYMGSHLIAKSYSSSRSSFSSPSRSSFSSSRSFSSPSRSSFSSPSKSFSSPSRSFSTPTLKPAPTRVSAPSVSAPSLSAPAVQRIDKQVVPKPVSKASPVTPRVAPPVVRAPRNTQPRVVTRETYVERYHDGGIISNPFFWMWALDNNRGGSQPQQQPTQVVVANTDGEKVTVPASQLVVQKNTWSPVREFFVFLLGGGVGVGSFIFLARPVLSRR